MTDIVRIQGFIANIARIQGIIAKAIRATRWDHSDGYPHFNAGKWDDSNSLGYFSSEEMAALCDFAGVIPDEIVSNGECKNCQFSESGHERGYVMPCLTCLRPKHDLFVPMGRVREAARVLAKAERDLVAKNKALGYFSSEEMAERDLVAKQSQIRRQAVTNTDPRELRQAILVGKTLRGKNKVREHGYTYYIERQAESVQFSDVRGPWLLLSSCGDDDLRWVHRFADRDFGVALVCWSCAGTGDVGSRTPVTCSACGGDGLEKS